MAASASLASGMTTRSKSPDWLAHTATKWQQVVDAVLAGCDAELLKQRREIVRVPRRARLLERHPHKAAADSDQPRYRAVAATRRGGPSPDVWVSVTDAAALPRRAPAMATNVDASDREATRIALSVWSPGRRSSRTKRCTASIGVVDYMPAPGEPARPAETHSGSSSPSASAPHARHHRHNA